MRYILLIIFLFTCFDVKTQVIDFDKKQENKIVKKYKTKNFFKNIYKDFFKYGTLYVAGDISNAYETSRKDYFVRPPEDGGLYDIPTVIDVTEYFPHDYRLGIGIRRIARFDYENREKPFYDGTETNVALSAPTAAVNGWEYLFHFEKERQRGEVFSNHRYFLRHTGKHHIVKIESREEGNVGFKYQSAEARARLPIGKKFSISAGVIARTHQTAYGYNPIEIWLNETEIINGEEYPVHYWYELGFLYGYDDIYYTQQDEFGNNTYDWYWINSNGDIVADSDLEFRNTVFGDLMLQYNNEQWDLLDAFAEYAPIVGFDYYTYTDKFWCHAYANYILPYHTYFKGDESVSYLNRNNWGKGGLKPDSKLEQWDDMQFGLMFGWNLTSKLGIFIEGEYTKFWDTELYKSTFGINLEL
jgi:hypothetical protein